MHGRQWVAHGDQAVYDALARMAQEFSMRLPLLDGQGNFGSIDGDPPAAMRYTEVCMDKPAHALLEDIEKDTVGYQPNYDGSEKEPVVLPARFPNLLVNGAGGIAVGMATNIPPHNLKEIVAALPAMIDDAELDVKGLLKHVKGPDFPTGGEMLNSKRELREIYETGQGAIRLRGEYTLEQLARGKQQIVVTSIPYHLYPGGQILCSIRFLPGDECRREHWQAQWHR